MKHLMNQEIANTLLGDLVNPARVKLAVTSDYTTLMSTENTNDCLTWFDTNAKRLEQHLGEHGYRWCYVIETAPGSEPFVYLLFSEDMTLEKAQTYTEDATDTLPEGREMHYRDCPFADIDINEYDHTDSSVMEQLLTEKADIVLNVREV